ncbi:glycosyltransferase family 4 protein [Swaminathania salitolerans]|uniref:Glycosyl transferase family 1 domain-containing protein n=1 Tax=Swaminathania salitolerans TaxID=182838 RepID=A0A511BLD6_9PROT|nr:glycosyltransferase family 4 protein [Swaminathania salitolerans]GBQ10084.1 hypothetical protein AA21291_0300 [Swaminathania salitolerans LMG 21291]GEL01159.1 hypothetical protein SSA02_03220 [Swaminathania salitolerans]
MKKIVFLNPFVPGSVSGGVKVVYQHASMLGALGYDVSVYQPAGAPPWLDVGDDVRVCDQFPVDEETVLVFPEVMRDWLLDFARTPLGATKIMFCQNQYYLYSYGIERSDLVRMGFTHFIVPGQEIARSLTTVLGLDQVHVVPISIDSQMFYPRAKENRIATNPKKWPFQNGNPALAHLIMNMLHLKYPETRRFPWIYLENMPQHEVAEHMGRSTIFLALSRQEAAPLTPLEAMASRCALVGFHGTGGKDYATHRNGHWFSPEQCEEIVDRLASLLFGFEHGDPSIDMMLDEAEKTARRYTIDETRNALAQVYGLIMSQSGRASLSL